MFHHILVPLDGSSLAECALPHAVAVARAFDSAIQLVHVLEGSSSNQREPLTDPLDWEMRKLEAELYLMGTVDRLQNAGVEAEYLLLEGMAAQRIVEFVHAHGTELIVLSSHGQSGLSAWTVNSVAQKVLMRVNTSVLLVPAYKPGRVGLTELRYRRLLVPVDGSQRAECVLFPANTLAASHRARLVLAHIVAKPELPRRMPPLPAEEELAARLSACNQEEGRAYLEQLQSRLSVHVKPYLCVSDDVAMRLHELADEQDVELIVMSAHGYSGCARWPYGSVTTSFILYGTRPLLIVQDFSVHEFEQMYPAIAVREYKGH